MKLHEFSIVWYILAVILAIVSQRSEGCGDLPEPEQIRIVMPVP